MLDDLQHIFSRLNHEYFFDVVKSLGKISIYLENIEGLCCFERFQSHLTSPEIYCHCLYLMFTNYFRLVRQ